VALVDVIKNLISNASLHFPYPIFATCLMNGCTGLLALLSEQVRRAVSYARIASETGLPFSSSVKCFLRGLLNLKPRIGFADFVKGLAPIGIMLGVEIGLSNKALQLLPVSLKTIVHACGPAAVLLCAWICGLENVTITIMIVLLLVVGGGSLSACASANSADVSLLGLGLALASLLMQGARWSITQMLLKAGRKMHLTEDDRRQVLAKLTGAVSAAKESGSHVYPAMYPAAGDPEPALRENLLRHPTCDLGDRASPRSSPRGVFSGLLEPKGGEGNSRKLAKARTLVDIPSELRSFVKKHVGSKTSHISKIEIAGLTNPLTALVCLIIALVFEPEAFSTPVVGWQPIMLRIVLCSVFVLLKMVLDLWLIQLTSAFIFSLAGVIHNLLIILSGVIVFGDRPEPLAWLGFATIASGVILYSWHKAKAAH